MRKKNTEQQISEEVLSAEYEAVYRFVLSLCRNVTEAQDITQETFLKAMKSYDKFAGNSSLYTWLCSIAKKLCYEDFEEPGGNVTYFGFDLESGRIGAGYEDGSYICWDLEGNLLYEE